MDRRTNVRSRVTKPGNTILCLLLAAMTPVGCQSPSPVASPIEQAIASTVQEVILPVSFTPKPNPIPPANTTPASVPPDGALSLADAINLALERNPRLREAAARVDAARAGQDIAFAPFLPDIGMREGFSAFNSSVIPGGAFVAASISGGAYAYNLAEAGVQWTLCDFGRTSGQYGQAVSQTHIAEAYLTRARQTVAFQVSQAYLRLLFTLATVRVREQAVEQARAILKDTIARRENGVAERESVLRADVEVGQAQEDLLSARQSVRDAQATLNLVLGQPTMLPVQVRDVPEQPPFDQTLEQSLQQAIEARPEITVGREAVAGAQYGEQAARAEFYPRIYTRGTVLRADSEGGIAGWVAGAGIHIEQKLYAGGRRLGEVRQNQAKIAGAQAGLQTILDNIGHEVNLAYQALPTNLERIRLGETTVKQADENLRLTIVRYKNGTATPTDVVDAQTADVRAQTRYFAAVYDYLEGLARLEYTQGGNQTGLLGKLNQAPPSPLTSSQRDERVP
jgi:outer membrane protein